MGFNQQVLDMNPAVLLTVLQSPAFSQGMTSLNNLEELHPGLSQYVIQYPGGSTLTATFHRGTTYKVTNKLATTVLPVHQEGYQSSTFGDGDAQSEGTGFSVTVTLSTPGSYSQNSVFNINYIADPFDTNGNPIPTQPDITNYMTDQYGYGVVQLDNESSQVNDPGSLEQQAVNEDVL